MMVSMASLPVAILVVTLTLFSNGARAKHRCDPPEDAVLWDSKPFDKEVEVTWAYGYNFTCHSRQTCNGSSVETEDLIVISRDDRMVIQLNPVELQLGNVLRFTPSQHMGIPFPIEVYKVDEDAFFTCNISGGRPLPVAVPANDTFLVPEDYLEVGNNYFITDSRVHPLINCHMGERVNVTVKAVTCDQDHVSMCSGWGNCVTRRGEASFHCVCCGNYRGDTCEIFDSCLSNPCMNGGLCVHASESLHRHSCNCSLGFYGEVCEHKARNLCQLVTCENNGTCVGNSTNFVCECPPGVTGTHCEVDINDCIPSPCHHGVCVDQRNGFRCYCEPGYDGHTCSEELRACELSPCRNNGFCQDVRAEKIESTFRCHCKRGWSGKDCTTKIPACEPNPCTNGICTEFNDTFVCHCTPGFAGSRCEVNINECSPNPCKFGGHCRDGINSHTCLCIHSHAGANCQYTPVDMFSPVLDEVDAEGHVIHNPAHMRNLYIVAACLTGVVVTMLAVLIACYCRLGDVCRRWCGCWALSSFWYRKQCDDLVVSVDVTSASDCPLAVDAFWSNPDPDISTLPGNAARPTFGNHSV